MNRRFFMKTLAVAVCTANMARINPLYAQSSSSSLLRSLDLDLSGPGRIGFYVDYSELDSTGVHTFYVCRTHGTEGSVSVSFSTSGDAHTNASGTLTWGDGEADIKSFNVEVPTKGNGDHRIAARLSNPTGGASLHHPTSPVAMGIIDDNTAATSNAIFIHADAASNGNGSYSNPYNNWYSARDAVTASTRFIYIRGNLVPDTTDRNDGASNVKFLDIGDTFSGRQSESERIVIRSWPGYEGGVDGGGQTDVAGFRGAADNTNYVTIRKLSFTNLDNRDGGSSAGKCYAIRTDSRNDRTLNFWTAEEIKIDGINSGQNAAVACWYTEGECYGYRLWRWNVANAKHQFNGKMLHTFESYDAGEVSIQRCHIQNTAAGFYQKKSPSYANAVGFSMRFNLLDGQYVRLSTQGTHPAANYHIIQGNVFKNTLDTYESMPIRLDNNGSAGGGTKHWIACNVFYNYDFSSFGMFTADDPGYTNIIHFNNIYSNVKRAWRYDTGTTLPEYADHNHYHNDSAEVMFDIQGTTIYSLSSLKSSTPYEKVATAGSPSFKSIASNDWSLADGSPCIGAGVSGSDQGIYLAGVEILGDQGLQSPGYIPVPKSPPSATTMTVEKS